MQTIVDITIIGKSLLTSALSTIRPFDPDDIAQELNTKSWFNKQLPITLPIAKSVLPRNVATNDVINYLEQKDIKINQS